MQENLSVHAPPLRRSRDTALPVHHVLPRARLLPELVGFFSFMPVKCEGLTLLLSLYGVRLPPASEQSLTFDFP